MKINKSTVLSHSSVGLITLQVPMYSLFMDPQVGLQDAEPTENYPDDLFATLKQVTGRTNGTRPTVGREEGFVYLTRKG